MKKFSTVDDYINSFPEEVKTILEKLRKTIKKVLPEAEESISYDMPTFKIKGKYVVYFAGWKHHVSLYPVPAGDKAFKKEISEYVASKGTIKFPLDKPIPYDLVEKTVAFLLKERSLLF